MLERNGAPNRIRTGVTALRGLCPGPLDDGSAAGPVPGRAHYREAARLLKLSQWHACAVDVQGLPVAKVAPYSLRLPRWLLPRLHK